MNLSFKSKLLALVGFLCVISISIGLVSYRGLGKVEAGYDKFTDQVTPHLNLVNSMYLEYRAVRINLRSLGLPNLGAEESKKYISEVEKAIENYEKLSEEYHKIPLLPGEKELFEQVDATWETFKAIGVRAIGLYKAGGAENMAKLNQIFLVDCVREASSMDAAIFKIKAFHTKNGEAFIHEAQSAEESTNQLMIIASLIGVLSGLSIGFIFATKVSNSISLVAQNLAANAEHVAAASALIASSSQELSQASTQQASSLEETAASLEEITAMISKSTENSKTTSDSSTESYKKAEEGRESVNQMLSSMDEISQSNEAILNQINESNRQMTEIVKVIQEIGNRTKIINEIVFQTKLLSFNASVEAARAGEHGKGFAVVAEEVGNLAQMSGNAAKEITDMLDASILKVEGIVKDTQQKVETLVHSGKQKVDSGVSVAKECSEVLNEIVQNVSRVSGLSQEILQASKEQSQGVSEINKAMTQLDSVTQQNAAASEEASGAAEELSKQADSLKSAVEELVTIISGTHQPPADSAHTDSKPTAKVVPFKKGPKKIKSFTKSEPVTYHAAASGDDFTPGRDDSGFKDI